MIAAANTDQEQRLDFRRGSLTLVFRRDVHDGVFAYLDDPSSDGFLVHVCAELRDCRVSDSVRSDIGVHIGRAWFALFANEVPQLREFLKPRSTEGPRP